MRRFWYASLIPVAVFTSARPASPLQGPGLRITYRVELVAGRVGGPVLASGEVSGPSDTRLRLGVRTDSVLVEALLSLTLEDGRGDPGDTVRLSGEFFTRRRLGRSHRGLPLWEEDAYWRDARLAWGDTARILPFGAPRGGGGGVGDGLRLDLIPTRAPTGGETRPAESVERADSAVDLTLEAVVRPRRVAVMLTLAQNGAGGVPRSYDLVPDAAGRRVVLPSGDRTRTLEIALARPDPPRAERDRALALDADVVCLRVLPAGPVAPVRELCGRLNNVARRLPLPGGDTLVTTFAWPGAR